MAKWIGLVAAMLVAGACSSPSSTGCANGAVVTCACLGLGMVGTQTCSVGALGACVCPAPDAGGRDVVGAETGVDAGMIGDSSPDTSVADLPGGDVVADVPSADVVPGDASFGDSASDAPAVSDLGGIVGEVTFATPGTNAWIVPAGVTSVSVVVVGAGGSGDNNVGSGGGGGLCYANSMPVVPGMDMLVIVGAGGTGFGRGSGGATSFNGVVAQGGQNAPAATGGFGMGGNCFMGGNGFGGGAESGGGAGEGGSGGAIGGLGGCGSSGSGCYGCGGGGVGLNGLGPSGSGGGGIGDVVSGATGRNMARGGAYGGGSGTGGGADGAVRIIWGPGRSFPLSAGP